MAKQKLSRDKQLARAAKARAAIIAFLTEHPSKVFTTEQLEGYGLGQGLDRQGMDCLLYRMVNNNLIGKTHNDVVGDSGRYRVGYKKVTGAAEAPTGRVTKYKLAKPQKSHARELDIIVGKDGRSVTLSLAGLKLNISVEA